MPGRAWKFGDNVSTDEITPGRYFHLRSNLPQLAKHTLEDARRDFVEAVQPGDFIVAGANFGMGSSREHAPTVIKMVGVRAVLAKSFARIFYRNCINIGLPAVICETTRMDEGDLLDLDLTVGKIYNRTKQQVVEFAPLPAVMAAVLAEGGLLPYVKKHGDLTLPGESRPEGAVVPINGN
jgi:3-isopropylmalate/(R)-2-methylmalate dehydratase small subunit